MTNYTPDGWLRRLDRAEIAPTLKALGRTFLRAHGERRRRPRWVAAWEVEGSWERDNTVGADLFKLKRQNLLAYWQGHFAPMIGPRPPRTGEYSLTPDQMKLIHNMLRLYGGRNLWSIARHGYIDRKDAKARWLLKPTSPHDTSKWPHAWSPTVPYRNVVVLPLARRGLIEPNGCTWGGFEWTVEYRVDPYRLYAIANLPAELVKYQRNETSA